MVNKTNKKSKKNDKQTRVRVLATGQTGTVTDRVLAKRHGHVEPYCQVRLDDAPGLDRWFYASQLGPTVERATATFTSDRGQELRVAAEFDHCNPGGIRLRLETGKNAGLEEQDGLHTFLLRCMADGLESMEARP